MEDPELEAIAVAMEEKTFEKGEIITGEGEWLLFHHDDVK